MEKVAVKNNIMPYIKGVAVGTGLSVVGVLALAFIYRLTGISDGMIRIINQLLKVASVFFGTLVCVREDRKKGLMKGSIVGICYTLATYIVFSLLSSSMAFNLSFVFDLLFGGVMGAICGVLAINMYKK